MYTSKLSDWESFLPITKSNGTTFYGGNQSWFSTNVGRSSGCGTVAAANITAYLARKHSILRALYSYDIDNITIDDFTNHMYDVFPYVSPLKIPFFDKPAGGIPFLSWCSNGIVSYAQSKGIKLNAHWSDDSPTFENAVKYIRAGLDKDCPVALINWWNPKLKNVQWTNPDTGVIRRLNFQFHWVTITALTGGSPTDEVYIDVSSWGSKVTLNFNHIWNCRYIFGYQGIIYFDW
jgi:hypothetical protein